MRPYFCRLTLFGSTSCRLCRIGAANDVRMKKVLKNFLIIKVNISATNLGPYLILLCILLFLQRLSGPQRSYIPVGMFSNRSLFAAPTVFSMSKKVISRIKLNETFRNVLFVFSLNVLAEQTSRGSGKKDKGSKVKLRCLCYKGETIEVFST